jgi:hypothetical protein
VHRNPGYQVPASQTEGTQTPVKDIRPRVGALYEALTRSEGTPRAVSVEIFREYLDLCRPRGSDANPGLVG